MKLKTLLLCTLLASCSSENPSFIDPTQAAQSGLVFECSLDGVLNDFAYTVNTESMVMEYWQIEGAQVVGRQKQFWIGSGRVGVDSLHGEGSYAVNFYTGDDGTRLSDIGTLSDFIALRIIVGSNNFAGSLNHSNQQIDVYQCGAVEYGLARVGGVLINQ